MPGAVTLVQVGRTCLAGVGQAWSRFWFQPRPTTPLEIARIGIGAAVLLHYAAATPYVLDFWGDSGWLPRALALENLESLWTQSVFFHFTAPWQWIAFHGVFLLCSAAFMLGWRTPWVKWIVLIGQISYAQRNPMLIYGVDKILASLLFILCLAPVGRALSLDWLRAVRAAKRIDLAAVPPPFASPWTGACTRLMQIQMAVLFLWSAIEKFRGDDWWYGNAIWFIFTNDELYSPFLLSVLASQYWLVNVATYLTLLIELAYPFLIWQRSTRPYLLAAAIFLHLQFLILMRMPYFSSVMIMGHMSFVRPEWLARLGQAWKRNMGEMEMIYDGRCAFCVRSMAWFLAFDGLGQIKTRDFRTNPSPVVSDAQLEKALYLVLPDGRALPGFEAYRYVVLRVPGLWWQVPFFYVPVLSRLLGHPIYNWIAANRSRLSAMRLGSPKPASSATE
jgi:predicted DCC family thiol-disulfide oxidoreductase YuxK